MRARLSVLCAFMVPFIQSILQNSGIYICVGMYACMWVCVYNMYAVYCIYVCVYLSFTKIDLVYLSLQKSFNKDGYIFLCVCLCFRRSQSIVKHLFAYNVSTVLSCKVCSQSLERNTSLLIVDLLYPESIGELENCVAVGFYVCTVEANTELRH